MPTLSLRRELVAHRARLKRLRWISGGAGVLAAATIVPQLLSQFVPSSLLRVALALASGGMRTWETAIPLTLLC